MTQKLLDRLPILGLLLLATSCGYLVNGPTEEIPVVTDPPGATVTEENTSQLAPTNFILDRNRDYVLTITKEGYETKTIKITHVISMAEAGNLIFGIPGLIIDTATGAAWELKPDKIMVTLRPLSKNEIKDQKLWLDEKTIKLQLQELERLKEAHLLTESEYQTIRNITVSCVRCPDEATSEEHPNS